MEMRRGAGNVVEGSELLKNGIRVELYDFLCCHSPMYSDLVMAIEELGIYPDFDKITDVDEVFKVTSKPPALYVDGMLKSEGSYLTKEEIKDIFLNKK